MDATSYLLALLRGLNEPPEAKGRAKGRTEIDEGSEKFHNVERVKLFVVWEAWMRLAHHQIVPQFPHL